MSDNTQKIKSTDHDLTNDVKDAAHDAKNQIKEAVHEVRNDFEDAVHGAKNGGSSTSNSVHVMRAGEAERPCSTAFAGTHCCQFRSAPTAC